MNTLTIVVKKPGEKAYVAQMEDDLKAMQSIVGGYIQYLPGLSLGLPSGLDMYSNEEAKIMPGHEPNVWLFDKTDQIWGTLFFVGGDDETGDSRSLTDDEVAEALDWCEKESV
jgi:hypothetical protein